MVAAMVAAAVGVPTWCLAVEVPQLEIVSVEVNEERLPEHRWKSAVGQRARPMELGSVRSLRVEFREQPGSATVAHQLRHALEGFGNRWYPVVAHAQMTVRFLDEQHNIVASKDYTFGSESGGWRGGVDGSVFHPRVAELEAPARARWVQMLAVPSVPAMVGVYAFRGVRIAVGSGGEIPVRVCEYSTEAGTEMDQALGSPADWARTGTKGEQAQVVRLSDGSHALSIVDSDPKTFGGWILRTDRLALVSPGESVRIEWSECFCVARGGQGVAEYGYLEAGKSYRLQMGVRSVEGREVVGGTELAFEVLPPFWRRPWMWGASGAGILWGALSVSRSVTRRRVQRRIHELDRKHAVEKERSRIARDIHDELGASLAQITLLSRLAREGLEDNSEVSRKLEDIAARAAGAGRQLAEIVWAINPARDSLEHLVGYLCGFAQEHLALAGVAFRTDIPEEFAAMPLESSARYNIFLAVRELIHNAVSHARPSVVYLRVRCEAVRLRVEVEDNGCGFDPGSVVPGRGLSNVRERMAQLAGEMVVCDVGGRGTCVVLSIPLQTSLRPEKNA